MTSPDGSPSRDSGGGRLAIILSAAWRAGMLRNARALARLLVEQRDDLEVVLAVRRDGPYDWPALEAEVATVPRTTIRRFQWATIPSPDAVRIYGFPKPEVETLMVPRDGGLDFLDCDGWIVFSNSLEGFVIPSRPVGIFCADLIQRHVPEIFGGADAGPLWNLQATTFRSWRKSAFVFSTTPATRQDVIEYAGVAPARAILTPTLIDPLAGGGIVADVAAVPARPYILWVTNASPHKNAVAAVAALKHYYEELAGGLDVVICGQDTGKLNPRSGDRAALASVFAAEPTVLEHLHFLGEVTDEAYTALVQAAAVVWHNVITDNGTFVAFDAARAGRNLVSSDYPQMRYLCERYGVAATYHRHDDPPGAARALAAAEQCWRSGELPSHQLAGDDPADKRRVYEGLLDALLRPQARELANHV